MARAKPRTRKLEFVTLDSGSLPELSYIHKISAGFPSPAADFDNESKIDLKLYLVKNPASTFFARVHGFSMAGAGIHDGDLIVIDKSLDPHNDDIAVCIVDGEFTLKRLRVKDGQCWLMPDNEDYEPIHITPYNDFMIWGIVVHCIKSFRN